jgi:hypothetical protein
MEEIEIINKKINEINKKKYEDEEGRRLGVRFNLFTNENKYTFKWYKFRNDDEGIILDFLNVDNIIMKVIDSNEENCSIIAFSLVLGGVSLLVLIDYDLTKFSFIRFNDRKIIRISINKK